MRKPDRLNALTGLRTFAAVNIVFFHFSNPQWFGIFAPVVNAGFASVSYFILLSGYVLAYNYGARARAGQLDVWRFYKARFTRLYPIYLLSLILAHPAQQGQDRHCAEEHQSHQHVKGVQAHQRVIGGAEQIGAIKGYAGDWISALRAAVDTAFAEAVKDRQA